MIRDTKGANLPVLAPKRSQALVADEQWTPGPDDRVFMLVGAATVNFKINAEETAWPLDPNIPIGIQPKYKFTAAANCTVLVE